MQAWISLRDKNLHRKWRRGLVFQRGSRRILRNERMTRILSRRIRFYQRTQVQNQLITKRLKRSFSLSRYNSRLRIKLISIGSAMRILKNHFNAKWASWWWIAGTKKLSSCSQRINNQAVKSSSSRLFVQSRCKITTKLYPFSTRSRGTSWTRNSNVGLC